MVKIVSIKDLIKEKIPKTIDNINSNLIYLSKEEIASQMQDKNKLIENLNMKISVMEADIIYDFMKLANAGWKIGKRRGSDNLNKIYLKKEIRIENIILGNEEYSLPDYEYELPVVTNVSYNYVDKILKATCKNRFYHPNVNTNSHICLGDIEDQNIFRKLLNIETLLKTANLNSAYGHEGKQAVLSYLHNNRLEKVNGEIFGSDISD